MSIDFAEIEDTIADSPGLYRIYTKTRIALKCGIGENLKRRLRNHRASYQSGLRLKQGGVVDSKAKIDPNCVRSKKSILAKHLFFDEEIALNYDLKTQQGRHDFLLNECYIEFEYTETKKEARKLERELESKQEFRYQGLVKIRPQK